MHLAIRPKLVELVDDRLREAIVTADVGPRIIRFGFVGGQNMFKEYADQLGKSGEAAFQLRGGSRVWKAPEDPVATWAPDNVPVSIKTTPNGLIATAPVEPSVEAAGTSLAGEGAADSIAAPVARAADATLADASAAEASAAEASAAEATSPQPTDDNQPTDDSQTNDETPVEKAAE